VKFVRKGKEEWKAEKTGQGGKNLERKKLTRIGTCITSDTS